MLHRRTEAQIIKQIWTQTAKHKKILFKSWIYNRWLMVQIWAQTQSYTDPDELSDYLPKNYCIFKVVLFQVAQLFSLCSSGHVTLLCQSLQLEKLSEKHKWKRQDDNQCQINKWWERQRQERGKEGCNKAVLKGYVEIVYYKKVEAFKIWNGVNKKQKKGKPSLTVLIHDAYWLTHNVCMHSSGGGRRYEWNKAAHL